MKLYATTTSERASKGQGGNEFIDIVIFDSQQKPLTKITMKPKGKEYEYTQVFYTTSVIQKGEKLKTAI